MSSIIRLGSESKSRASILTNAKIEFIQSPIGFDEEQIIASSPKNFVYQATVGKFLAGLKLFGCEDYPLLVADTVVTSQNRILRKAKDINDAREILLTQSGNITSIVSCMIYKTPKLEIIDISTTDYVFSDFDTKDLERYLESGEWKGKAGGCMVEGFCKPYIKEVRGYESCAMGLSVEKLLTWI